MVLITLTAKENVERDAEGLLFDSSRKACHGEMEIKLGNKIGDVNKI